MRRRGVRGKCYEQERGNQCAHVVDRAMFAVRPLEEPYGRQSPPATTEPGAGSTGLTTLSAVHRRASSASRAWRPPRARTIQLGLSRHIGPPAPLLHRPTSELPSVSRASSPIHTTMYAGPAPRGIAGSTGNGPWMNSRQRGLLGPHGRSDVNALNCASVHGAARPHMR